MKRLKALICALVLSAPLQAFTPYFAAGHYLRWNVESGVYNTNLVNPANHKIRFYISSDAWSAANRTAELNAVRASFDQWQSVPGTSVRFEDAGLAPKDIEAKRDFTNAVFWCNTPDKATRNQVVNRRAYTWVYYDPNNNQIVEADIALNGYAGDWFTDFNNTTNQAQFVEAVLCHEIGHLLGLDHTPVGGGTVISGPVGVSTEAGLSTDEIAAARFLYPGSIASLGTISGKASTNGVGILGALITLEDTAGNVVQGTVTRADGTYIFPMVAPGTYGVRASPLDPKTASAALMKGSSIALAGDYNDAVTSFLATDNATVQLAANGTIAQDFALTPAEPPFRISHVAHNVGSPNFLYLNTGALKIKRGANNDYMQVTGPGLPADAILSITGDGITMGPTSFRASTYNGLNTLTAFISVAPNATPGLRSFVVRSGSNFAYANGYLEIGPVFPDYNFDGLDDRFQRKFFPLFTAPEAAPAADPDHDHFSNSFEFRTGTDPTDATSYRLLVQFVRRSRTGVVLNWASEAGKRYQLFGRNAFGPGSSWQLVGSPVTATNEVTTGTDSSGAAASPIRIYELELLP